MARKVTVGSKNPQNGGHAVSVEFDDQSNPGGGSVHVKVVIPAVHGEAQDDYIRRAAEAARHLVDSMSDDIGAGRYEKRHTVLSPPPANEDETGG